MRYPIRCFTFCVSVNSEKEHGPEASIENNSAKIIDSAMSAVVDAPLIIKLEVGCAEDKGSRHTMEDACVIMLDAHEEEGFARRYLFLPLT